MYGVYRRNDGPVGTGAGLAGVVANVLGRKTQRRVADETRQKMAMEQVDLNKRMSQDSVKNQLLGDIVRGRLAEKQDARAFNTKMERLPVMAAAERQQNALDYEQQLSHDLNTKRELNALTEELINNGMAPDLAYDRALKRLQIQKYEQEMDPNSAMNRANASIQRLQIEDLQLNISNKRKNIEKAKKETVDKGNPSEGVVKAIIDSNEKLIKQYDAWVKNYDDKELEKLFGKGRTGSALMNEIVKLQEQNRGLLLKMYDVKNPQQPGLSGGGNGGQDDPLGIR